MQTHRVNVAKEIRGLVSACVMGTKTKRKRDGKRGGLSEGESGGVKNEEIRRVFFSNAKDAMD